MEISGEVITAVSKTISENSENSVLVLRGWDRGSGNPFVPCQKLCITARSLNG